MGRRRAAVAGAAGLLAVGGVLAAKAAARDPRVRAELERGRRFVSRVEPRSPTAPVPPPLPPGRALVLPGRGETFVRDTGGVGPAVLLLHGWTASADLNWFGVYDRLAADGLRVLAVDHRGHGRGIRSDEPLTLEACADDAAAVLDVLGVGPAVVVGYSMGGPIAMHLASRHRHAVSGLVVQATALEFRSHPLERFAWGTLAVSEVLLRAGTADGVVERSLRDLVERRPDLAPLVPWMDAEISRGDARGIVAAGRALGRYDARPWVADLRTLPSAAVVTTEDRLVRQARQRALAEHLGAEVIELAADHDAPAVAREAFADATSAAIASGRGRVAPDGDRASPDVARPAAAPSS